MRFLGVGLKSFAVRIRKCASSICSASAVRARYGLKRFVRGAILRTANQFALSAGCAHNAVPFASVAVPATSTIGHRFTALPSISIARSACTAVHQKGLL